MLFILYPSLICLSRARTSVWAVEQFSECFFVKSGTRFLLTNQNPPFYVKKYTYIYPDTRAAAIGFLIFPVFPLLFQSAILYCVLQFSVPVSLLTSLILLIKEK